MEQLGLVEGSEVDISLEQGRLILSAANREYQLQDLVDGITTENLHRESDWGRPKGHEVW